MKKLAERPPAKHIPPALDAMLGGVMEHIAALAERCQVVRVVVRRIVVKVCAGKHDIGWPAHIVNDAIRAFAQPAALAVAPDTEAGIPPPAIAQVKGRLQVRSSAPLAS